MKRRIYKKHLAAVFAVVIMLSLVVSVSAAEVSEISLSNDPSTPVKISSSGMTIRVDGLPSGDSFKYIWIFFSTDASPDNNVGGGVSERQYNNSDARYYVEYTFNNLPNGTYYLQMYTNSSDSGMYQSYLHSRKLPVRIANGSMSFVLSAAYENSINVSKSKRTDFTALEYYLSPTSEIQSDNDSIKAQANAITNGLTSDYEKAKAIHDWVCNNIYYDYDMLNKKTPRGNESALSTLSAKHGVCTGFSNLIAAFLRASGIPAKTVDGYGLVGDEYIWTSAVLQGGLANHTWNEAYVDGRWIIIDATWDTANEYENGKISNSGGLISRKYFDPTQEFFASDHMLQAYSESGISAPPSGWAEDDVLEAHNLNLIPNRLHSNYQNRITRNEFSDLIVRFIEVHTDRKSVV